MSSSCKSVGKRSRSKCARSSVVIRRRQRRTSGLRSKPQDADRGFSTRRALFEREAAQEDHARPEGGGGEARRLAEGEGGQDQEAPLARLQGESVKL